MRDEEGGGVETVASGVEPVASGVETVKLCCLTLTTGPGTAFTHFQVLQGTHKHGDKPALICGCIIELRNVGLCGWILCEKSSADILSQTYILTSWYISL